MSCWIVIVVLLSFYSNSQNSVIGTRIIVVMDAITLSLLASISSVVGIHASQLTLIVSCF
jgi:hypothetical protein